MCMGIANQVAIADAHLVLGPKSPISCIGFCSNSLPYIYEGGSLYAVIDPILPPDIVILNPLRRRIRGSLPGPLWKSSMTLLILFMVSLSMFSKTSYSHPSQLILRTSILLIEYSLKRSCSDMVPVGDDRSKSSACSGAAAGKSESDTGDRADRHNSPIPPLEANAHGISFTCDSILFRVMFSFARL